MDEIGFAFVEECLKILEFGLGVEGIYAVAGSSKRIIGLMRSALDPNIPASERLLIFKDPKYQQIHVITSALKKYFGDLEETLLTNQLYDHFVEAASEYSIDPTS